MFVPAYVSADNAIDLAVKAIVHARSSQARSDSRSSALASSYYSKAIEAVRKSLSSSDQTLLAVALLSLYEYLVRSDFKAWLSHTEGISAIIIARGESTPISDLCRAILYGNGDHAFHRSCSLGQPSPFEAQALLESEPSFRSSGVLRRSASFERLGMSSLSGFRDSLRTCDLWLP